MPNVNYNDYLPSDKDLNDKNDADQRTFNAKRKNERNKNSRAYRRHMRVTKDKRLRAIICSCGYIPHAGWIEHDWKTGNCIGKYIKYPKNSNAQRFLKRYSNRIVRKHSIPLRGAGYKKLFDYWWSLY